MIRVRLIKNICKAENIDIKQLAPKYILSIIDRWKNKGFIQMKLLLIKMIFMKKLYYHFIKFINKNY